MISIAWKFIAVIGVAGVIALAVTPADARSARSARSTVSNQAFCNVPQSSVGLSVTLAVAASTSATAVMAQTGIETSRTG